MLGGLSLHQRQAHQCLYSRYHSHTMLDVLYAVKADYPVMLYRIAPSTEHSQSKVGRVANFSEKQALIWR